LAKISEAGVRRTTPRSTAYRHKKRIEELGRWEPLSTRPKSRPDHQTPPQVEAEIVQLRQELDEQPGQDCGADNVRYYLQQIAALEDWAERGWRVPSRATIHKIMKRHGLVRPEPQKRPKSSYRRFAYARPRDCYQIDATEVRLAGGAKAVVFEVLDDCTRLLVATLAWEVENAAGAIAAITRAFDRFGVPALVLADNGSAFTCRTRSTGASRFTRMVTAAGARLIHSSPYHPQTCGKVERHHRTFKAWLHAQPVPPANLAELQAVCDSYQAWYNTGRGTAPGTNHHNRPGTTHPPSAGQASSPCSATPKSRSSPSSATATSDSAVQPWSRSAEPTPALKSLCSSTATTSPSTAPEATLSVISTSTGDKPDNNSAQPPSVSHNYLDTRVPQLRRQHTGSSQL
jgi:transposase InsO family protein